MEREPLQENAASRERLAATVERLTEPDLGRETSPGWTVAVCLVQLAFWDRWAEHLIGRWRSGQMPPPTMPPWYDDAINATMAPIWRAIPVSDAGRLAIDAADAVDLAVGRVETPVVAAILSTGEGHLLHRHAPRTETLNIIDQAVGRPR